MFASRKQNTEQIRNMQQLINFSENMAEFKYTERTATNHEYFTLKVKELRFLKASRLRRIVFSAINTYVGNSRVTIQGNMDAEITCRLKLINLRECLPLFCPESSIYSLFLSKHISMRNYYLACCFV